MENTKMNKMRDYDLISVEQNPIWKFVVIDPILKNKNGDIKAIVKEIADIADDTPNEEWDLIVHKNMVAFKIPTERITCIYSKQYWDSRCSQNLTNLKVLKI